MQNIAYFMILMLTKHPSYSFSCLTPYICVFCRNEENEMKSKQFGQELKKLCGEEVVVRDHRILWSRSQAKSQETEVVVWSRPQLSPITIE